jgi:signal transduction histidine kinase
MGRIEWQDWITIASCVGHLALAFIALRRISSTPLGLPLGLLCVDLFVFNASDAANHISPLPQWRWLDAAGTSLMPTLAAWFVLTFVGKSRSLAWLSRAFDLYFGALALACALAFADVGWSQEFGGRPAWGWAMGAGTAVVVGVLAWQLTAHLRASESPLERARTWLIISALALGAAGNFVDLFAVLGFSQLKLGPLSLFATTLVLSLAALRLGLFEKKISWLLVTTALVLGALQLFGYLGVYYFFGGNPALVALGVGALTLALVPPLVAMTRNAAAHRQRLEYHATLGRFSAQMAHDLRNPLAAIKGAAQYLEGEAANGKPLEGAGKFLGIIVQQANRLERTIADYQRIGRTQAELKPSNLNQLVEAVLGGQDLAAPQGIMLQRKLEPAAADCALDADLVSAALENLVRNAFEAMPTGGSVTVETERPAADPGYLWLSVIDTGPGMDARHLERAGAEFFTTKASGSGLGLAFVRRVAEAHGGDASIKSAEGKGTTVRLRLPVNADQR